MSRRRDHIGQHLANELRASIEKRAAEEKQHEADVALGRQLRERPTLFAWAMELAKGRVFDAPSEFDPGDYEALRHVEAELRKERDQ